MPYSESGPQRRMRPMLPDGSVEWERTEIASGDGVLYTVPDFPAHLAGEVIYRASHPFDRRHSMKKGSCATVREQDGLVYKRFDKRVNIEAEVFGGIDSVIANVALGYGLNQLEPLEHSDYERTVAFTVSAPELYAAFVPNQATSDNRPVWLMSYEAGTEPTGAEIPRSHERMDHYVAALTVAGLDSEAVDFDDYTDNLLLGPAHDDISSRRLVKLDIFARQGYTL